MNEASSPVDMPRICAWSGIVENAVVRGAGGGTLSCRRMRCVKASTCSSYTLVFFMLVGHCHLWLRSTTARKVSKSKLVSPCTVVKLQHSTAGTHAQPSDSSHPTVSCCLLRSQKRAVWSLLLAVASQMQNICTLGPWLVLFDQQPADL